MKTFSQRPGKAEHCSVGSGQEQPVRLWLVGSVGLVFLACVVAVLVYSSGPDPKPPATAPLGSARVTSLAVVDRDRHDPGPGAVNPSPGTANSSPDEAALPLQAPVEAYVAQDDESPEFDPSALSDPATLRGYLSSGYPVLADAVLKAASRHDREVAARALLDILTDGAEPRRQEVLQRLCASPYVDAETLTSALRAALQDPDYGLVTQAVRELSDRSDATAIGLLSEALDKGELSTRLLIVESIASNSSAVRLLQQGLKDPDETVRNTAQAVLSIRNRPSALANEVRRGGASTNR